MAEVNRQIVRHSDREIARILQRAAELQERDREEGTGTARGGLSVEELKQVAAEVGIDPRYVEAAAAELDDAVRGRRRFFFWGAPGSTEMEQVVDGEVSEAEWEALLAAIRRSMGQTGNSSTLGQTLEWNGSMDHVSISPRAGQTRIRILSQQLLSRFYPVHVLAITCSSILLQVIALQPNVSLPEVLALCTASTGAVFGLARAVVGALVRGQTQRMKELLRELAEHVERTAPRLSEETSAAAAVNAATVSIERDTPAVSGQVSLHPEEPAPEIRLGH